MPWSAAAMDYFAERAIDPELAEELGVIENADGLAFPYPSAEDEQFARTRSLNGTGPKVRQPKGTSLCPWRPTAHRGDLVEALVVEGESDALAAVTALRGAPVGHLESLPVVAIPGTGFPVERMAQFLADAKVAHAWLAFDADDAGRKYTQKLITELSITKVRVSVVELAEGQDLADCLAAVAEGERGGWIANLLVDTEAAALDADEEAAEEETAVELGVVLPPPNRPMEVARALARDRYALEDGTPTLRHWRGGWWQWRGSHWVEIEQRAARAAAYAFTEDADYLRGKDLEPWAPNRYKVADLLEAIAAISHLPESVAQPAWIEGGHEGVIVACANGLLDVDQRVLLDHTPAFFNVTAVPFDYDPQAAPALEWLKFLHDLWENDDDSTNALQEFFGYVISGRLDLHKILLLVGPTRAGKGVIARTLTAMIGNDNVAGPTLSSLASDFGLAPLLGKPLAVISDARLAGRGSSVVVERLLAISGEDTITVNRKYKDQWTGKLPSRFMVISNELPQLGDASAAIAGRFVTLLLTKSWLGEEDTELESRLRTELTGILNWSLDGLRRLDKLNRFTKPASTNEAYIALQDLASPVGAFIRDRCVVGPDHQVPVDELWDAWKSWAQDNGHTNSTKQVLGRNLRAAHPRVRVTQPGSGDNRDRVYAGITLQDRTHG